MVFPLVLVLTGVMCVPSTMAQTASTGALTGTVTDPSRAVVVKAEVGITNLATGQSQATTTGPNGAYRFSLLAPGKYKVTINMAGFKHAEFASITINVTETTVVDCALEIGAPNDTYVVKSEAEILQTANPTMGTLVDSETIVTLPLTSRNYTQILDLSTGVNASVHDATVMGKGTQYTSVNGATPAQNNYQMDGVPIVNIGMNGSAGDQSTGAGIGIPSPDAIQEFKVQTSTFDASYGRNPGGNVNVVTKSGSNTLHGSAFEFMRNTSLNANPFFYNRDNPNSATKKPILNQNQFGLVLGGPVIKDRFFLFGSYQGSRQKNGLSSQGLASFSLPPIPAGDRSAPGFAASLAAANCSFTSLWAETCLQRIQCQSRCAQGSATNEFLTEAITCPDLEQQGTKQVLFSNPARYSGRPGPDQFGFHHQSKAYAADKVFLYTRSAEDPAGRQIAWTAQGILLFKPLCGAETQYRRQQCIY